MLRTHMAIASLIGILASPAAMAQSEHEATLCEAATTGRVVALVYDADVSKGCLPRIVDVHQVAVGNNGRLYLHGWQTRGCTSRRDFESERIYRFDKIKSVDLIDGDFNAESLAVKAEGWDGCIGTNCFIEKTICE